MTKKVKEEKPSWPVRAWRNYRERRKAKAKKPPWFIRLLRRLGVNLSPRGERLVGWAETIVEVGVLVILIINFVTVRMTVPTGSMVPTIIPGDSFFVDIISYHFRDPTPGSVVVFWFLEELQITKVQPGSAADAAGLRPNDFLVYPGRYDLGVGDGPVPSLRTLSRRIEEAQGGTLAFRALRPIRMVERTVVEGTVVGANLAVPKGANDLADLGISMRARRARYVKRLIAVGGQTVQIAEGGKILVDGEPLAAVADWTYARLGPGLRYGVEPTLVPEGHLYVLGDNTMNSYDSRYWGFVPKEEFIGCPFFRVWPFSRFSLINGYFGSSLF